MMSDDPVVELAAQAILQILEPLTPDQREDVHFEITQVHCASCWREAYPYGDRQHCQCNNDE